MSTGRKSADSVSLDEVPEDEQLGILSRKQRVLRKAVRYIKISVLAVCWLISTFFLMRHKESQAEPHMISVLPGVGKRLPMPDYVSGTAVGIKILGPFTQNSFKYLNLKSEQALNKRAKAILSVQLRMRSGEDSKERLADRGNWSNEWVLQLVDEALIDTASVVSVEKVMEEATPFRAALYQFFFSTNLNRTLPLQLYFESSFVSHQWGNVLAVVLLCVIYVHIIWDLVHRTLAAVIGCTLAVAILAAVHLRPSLRTIFGWVNIETVMLIFGLSIMVGLLAETGVQNYLAAVSYELANGHIWPMLNVLLLADFVLSTIFNGIAVMLFLSPIALRLCEIMQLSPVPILSALIVVANVGSTLTPVSAMSNMVITAHPVLGDRRIGFGTFLWHMLPATLLTLAQSYVHLRLQFVSSRKMRIAEPQEVDRLRRLIKVWRRTAAQIGAFSRKEEVVRHTVQTKIQRLRHRLKRLGRMPTPPHDYEETVQSLRQTFPIRRGMVLVSCSIALTFAVLLFLLESFTTLVHVSPGWIAVLGAILALTLADYEQLEVMLGRLDWATMLFYASMLILMEVLIKLGLLETVGMWLERFILHFGGDHRLTAAILAVLWLSALLTVFLDSIPVADMMMRIIVTLSHNETIDLPLLPLVFSLALGCCLGGNGSLAAAISNVVCAGVASRHGYNFYFLDYLKVGFPLMVGNLLVASAYLLLAHVALQWH